MHGLLYDDITSLSPLKDGDFGIGDNRYESHSEDLKKGGQLELLNGAVTQATDVLQVHMLLTHCLLV